MPTDIEGILYRDEQDRVNWLAAYQLAETAHVAAVRQLGNTSLADNLQRNLDLIDSEVARRNWLDRVAAVRAELAHDRDRLLRVLAAGDIVIGLPWTTKPPRGPRTKRRWFHFLAPADMWEP